MAYFWTTGTCFSTGFQLESLGDARQAGERFLSSTVAPEGSGREAQLLSATERCSPWSCHLLPMHGSSCTPMSLVVTTSQRMCFKTAS